MTDHRIDPGVLKEIQRRLADPPEFWESKSVDQLFAEVEAEEDKTP